MTWRMAPSAGGLNGDAGAHAVVAQHRPRELPQALLAQRRAHDADAALRARLADAGGGGVGVVAGGAVADGVGPGAAARAAAGGVGGGDDDPLAVAGDVDVGRVPGRGDEADPLLTHVEHRDRVLAAERDVERLPSGATASPFGIEPGAAPRAGDRHRALHAVALGVDHRDGVRVAVGGVDLVAARVGGDRVQVVGELRVGGRREQDAAPHGRGARVDHDTDRPIQFVT